MGTHPIFESDFDCLTEMTECVIIKFHQGGKDHLLELDASRTVSYMLDRIEDVTEIPPANMKVLFAGKCLEKFPSSSLVSLGLKGKCKVMVMGKKVNSAEEILIKGLKPMISDFETKKTKLEDAERQVNNYENGFIQETKPIDKDIQTIAEYCMRILEKLDGYAIAEEHKVARQKRKDLVKSIQMELDRC